MHTWTFQCSSVLGSVASILPNDQKPITSPKRNVSGSSRYIHIMHTHIHVCVYMYVHIIYIYICIHTHIGRYVRLELGPPQSNWWRAGRSQRQGAQSCGSPEVVSCLKGGWHRTQGLLRGSNVVRWYVTILNENRPQPKRNYIRASGYTGRDIFLYIYR